jgi:hypothetical protein
MDVIKYVDKLCPRQSRDVGSVSAIEVTYAEKNSMTETHWTSKTINPTHQA